MTFLRLRDAAAAPDLPWAVPPARPWLLPPADGEPRLAGAGADCLDAAAAGARADAALGS